MNARRAAPALPALLLIGAITLAAALPARATTPPPATRLAHHSLVVALDPATRTLQVRDDISVSTRGPIELSLGESFHVVRLRLDGAPVRGTPTRDGGHQRWSLVLGASPATHTIAIRYRGRLAALEHTDFRGVLGDLPAMASPQGSYLPAGSGWYPQLRTGRFTYRLRLRLPAGQVGLVPGTLLRESASADGYRVEFAFSHPAEGISLMAGPYRVEQRWVTLPGGGRVRLRTYFHPQVETLAASYLDAAAGYVQRYSKSIGPYPYRAFSMVSSPLPTGFGMPTLTYLGVDVLRLPFIRNRSLGHEILHNWWGNGVYVNWSRGNWCEGLTTFLADYAYQEDAGPAAARRMRREWLRDFAALPPARDEPLRAFTSRRHDASQIVGYDKAAFVFFMLRDAIGETAFRQGLRLFWREWRFRRASWSDLRHAFEKAAGRSLATFFAQWLDRSGAPALHIVKADAEPASGHYRIRFTLAQGSSVYALEVPVVVHTIAGDETRKLSLDAPRAHYAIDVAAAPRRLTVDPDFRLFRRLQPGEMPPILREATLDPATVAVLATSDPSFREPAHVLLARLLDVTPHWVPAAHLPQSAPLVVIGTGADVASFLAANGLPPRPSALPEQGSAHVWTATQPDGKILLAIAARDAGALQALLRPLPHYGRESWLVFEGDKVSARGVWPAQPVGWRFAGHGGESEPTQSDPGDS